MEEPNRAIPLTYEKAMLYMVGPLCFVASATVFWAFVHCVLVCLFSDKYNRDKKQHNLENESSVSAVRTPKSSKKKKGRSRSSLITIVRSKVDKYDEEWTFKDTKRYLIVSILVTMVILHPTLTRQCLFMFMCVKIENGTYLRKDVQLECYTDEHITYLLTVGIPGILACKILCFNNNYCGDAMFWSCWVVIDVFLPLIRYRCYWHSCYNLLGVVPKKI